MTCALATLSFALMVSLAPIQYDMSSFSESGINLKYPKSWMKKVRKKKGVTVATLSSGPRTRVELEISKSTLPPGKTLKSRHDYLLKSFTKTNQLVIGSDKKTKRTIFGQIRHGREMTLRVKDSLQVTFESFAIKTKTSKKLLFITLHKYSDENERDSARLKSVCDSLSE